MLYSGADVGIYGIKIIVEDFTACHGKHFIPKLRRYLHFLYFPEGSRTALAFLKKKEDMKIYTEHGNEMSTMKGSEIFHNYFDTVNANIRTAMEHKSDEREMGQENSKESDRTERTSSPEAGKTAKGRAEKTGASKDAIEKTRTAKKEIKQPVKGR